MRQRTIVAVLATAGDLIFWGDLDHKFRAFDAVSGRVMWEQQLNGPIQNSTVTYATGVPFSTSALTMTPEHAATTSL